MKVKTYNMEGAIVSEVVLPPEIFELAINKDLIKQALIVQMANQRKPLAYTKGRAEVRGGGRKPWRQKGTGRSRHGSIRSPLWRGGGITFGPTKDKIYKKKINKKMKRQALLMMFSSKAKDNEIRIMESLKISQAKTKEIFNLLKKLDIFKSCLIITANKKIRQAARNIPKTKTIQPDSLNVLDLLKHKYLLMSKKMIEIIKKTYGNI